MNNMDRQIVSDVLNRFILIIDQLENPPDSINGDYF